MSKKGSFFKNKKTIEIAIYSEFITLGQFLKLADLISSGGEAKIYLSHYSVVVNGEQENRRGRKLYEGTTIEAEDKKYHLVKK